MIAVLDYGIGNLRSAEKALVHLGADACLVTSERQARGATGIVLPGVGAFGACIRALRSSGLERVAMNALAEGTPFLGVCVGLQMLYEASDEEPGEKGLGVLEGRVRSLPSGVKRPQMQWNVLLRSQGSRSRLLEGLGDASWVYFVHSYAPEMTDDVVATCEYGGVVVAAVERDSLWGTQFHPEKSGATGLAILRNFTRQCA